MARDAEAQSITSYQDFGSAAVNGAPASATVSFQLTGVSPAFSLAYGLDFSLGKVNCTGGSVMSCSVPVNFVPRFAGLRQDALIVKNGVGNIVATTFLRGAGLGPLGALLPGVITTIVGNPLGGYSGDGGPATAATLRAPQGVAIDASGNLFIADSLNQVVRKINKATGIITTIAGNGYFGFSGDDGPATSASLNTPTAVAVDGAGNLYIADFGNNRVRTVNAATGIITTVAGGGSLESGIDGLGDGGLATNAVLSGPSDIAVDAAGNLYIADSYHGLIREVNASSQVISVIAGGGSNSGSDGFGDGGPATSASLNDPTGVSLDVSGNVYIADNGHNLVREVNASSGTITAVAGNGSSGYGGDHGPATSARLARPWTIRVDAAGDLFIADFGNSLIREVNGATGIITTFAGSSSGYGGDNGSPVAAQLQNPTGLAIDPSSNIYIADYANNVVRLVTLAIQSITFPSVPVSQPSSSTISVMNAGNQALGFSQLAVSGPFSQVASGSQDCSSSSSLSSAAACSIALTFTPQAAGNATGSLTFATNSLNSGKTQTITLNGTATQNAAPQAVLTPNILSFATQTVGTSSAAQTVTLSNPGGSSLSISSIWLYGPAAGDFLLTSTTCGSTLSAKASCTVSIAFSPVAIGTRTATLAFTDTATGSPQTVSLAGTGLSQISLSAASLNFGPENLGGTTAPQTITLTNSSDTAVTFAGISLSGANPADFAFTSNCATSIAAGAKCSVSVTFSPGATGARSASLSFNDNAIGAPQSVSLTGSGTVSVSLSPTSLTFGPQTAGTQSAPQTISISNASTVALSLSSVWLSGPNGADFLMTDTCGSTLAAGATCSISISFLPTGLGTRVASLTLTDTGTGAPQTIPLVGTGVGFVRVAGYLRQISVGADGAVWGINAAQAIYRYDFNLQTWVGVPGALAQIAVGNQNAIWGLSSAGFIYRYDPKGQVWVNVPGFLSQIAVGADGDVWGLNAGNLIYHFNASAQNWANVPGFLTSIAVGFDGAVWGLNGGSIYRYNPVTASFQQIPGMLSQISIGSDGSVWGINGGVAYRFNPVTQGFESMGGQLTQIVAASANNVWGIGSGGTIAYYDLSNKSWVTFSGALATIAAGANGAVWDLDSTGAVYQSLGASLSSPSFHQVSAPLLTRIATAVDGNAWGIDQAGTIYAYNLATQSWSPMGNNFAQVAVAFGQNVWALDGSGAVYHFDLASQTLLQVAGWLSQVSVASTGDVWGVNSGGLIYRYNSQTQNWTQILGLLSQLSVAPDGTVWGLTSTGSIYRFDPQKQTWVNVPGFLTQVATGSSAAVWGLSGTAIYAFNFPAQSWQLIPGSLAQISIGFDNSVWGTNAGNQTFTWNGSNWIYVPVPLTSVSVSGDAVIWGLNAGQVYRFY